MTDHLSPHVSPSSPTVERLTHYTKVEQSQILGDGADPFGVADLGFKWLPKEEHFGIRRAGRLVAHTGLLRIPLSIGGVDTPVVGVGGVAVAPDQRGRGLARLVVAGALDHARTMGPTYGLLFCRPPLVALYQRLGWRALEQDVQVDQPAGPVIMPLHTMWTPLHDAEASWPAGTVRLLSLPM
ncbi:putative N-acetyltransferase YhbS [Kitasatospora sp. MAP12-15]|uniref:GNAT family N-acetyltransferase n=1 Tax=unclassified Kitasatospora TaxID=2633591 RepID=UPI0024750C48|nr:GNAT family N-acetyltransferase [Kitasatospora sp. MAP12-44]MDH6114080.1 putative N-acetyltransferase YhbS [Kitasatospora sp. MAP12-44]